MSVRTIDGFHKGARQLRAHFDKRFENPHSNDPGRFVWDYWHVPGQYTVLRTPAYHFFPAREYRALHERIVLWGRENLGCHDISPPWLSCYIDGCRQDFHADLPHGPWAFVYSLTPWETRKFLGGETFLLREEMLDYWRHLDRYQGLEEDQILKFIEPRFNRLTVFDPRVPHGVRRVEGVSDPRQGRLVIHGWFVNPRPFIQGPLRTQTLQSRINDLLGALENSVGGSEIRGMISVGFAVGANGRARGARILSNTLVDTARVDPGASKRVEHAIGEFLRRVDFGRQRAPSRVTLPLVFGA